LILAKIKLKILQIDELFFKGYIKAFHSRYFAYRGKAYVLTKDLYFPPHTSSNKSVRLGPEGELLAIGGDLTPERMVYAFKNGIYQISFKDQPILWWTSEIHCVLFLENIHISNDVQKFIKKENFRLTVDKAYYDVVKACSESRNSWLTPERMASSFELHELGFTHSVEVWQGEKLVGGLFGIALGSSFYGESMFARVKNSSKVAFTALCIRLKEMNYLICDCGIWPTDHLKSFGADIIPRDEFLGILDQSVKTPNIDKDWENLFEDWDFKSAIKNYVSLAQKNKEVSPIGSGKA